MAGCAGFSSAEGCPKSVAKTSLVRFADRRTACIARCSISWEKSGAGTAGSLLEGITSAMVVRDNLRRLLIRFAAKTPCLMVSYPAKSSVHFEPSLQVLNSSSQTVIWSHRPISPPKFCHPSPPAQKLGGSPQDSSTNVNLYASSFTCIDHYIRSSPITPCALPSNQQCTTSTLAPAAQAPSSPPPSSSPSSSSPSRISSPVPSTGDNSRTRLRRMLTGTKSGGEDEETMSPLMRKGTCWEQKKVMGGDQQGNVPSRNPADWWAR